MAQKNKRKTTDITKLKISEPTKPLKDVSKRIEAVTSKKKILRGTSLYPTKKPNRILKRNPITGFISDNFIETYSEVPRFQERWNRIKTSGINIATAIRHPIIFRRDSKYLPKYVERRAELQRMRNDMITAIYAKTGVRPVAVYSRVKRWYSIRESAKRRNLHISDVPDAYGIRFIVPKVKDAYKVANFLVRIPTTNPNESHVKRVTDYIKRPRSGGYRALHVTTDAFARRKPPKKPGARPSSKGVVEVQIKTPKMVEETAEFDRLMGIYGKTKNPRKKLGHSIDVFYHVLYSSKDPTIRKNAFESFYRATKKKPEYYDFVTKTLRKSRIITKNQVKAFKRVLEENLTPQELKQLRKYRKRQKQTVRRKKKS